MVMEREILWKVSNLWGCGIFLPGVGRKPDENRSCKAEKSSNSCSLHISAGLTDSRMLGC